jgi:hypothetical protein
MMAGAMGNPKSSNYKTRICLNWHKNGQCQYAQVRTHTLLQNAIH